MKKILFLILSISYTHSAFAEYYAQGDIIAYEHSTLRDLFPSMMKPTQKIVHSVRQKDGKVYKMRRIFQNTEVTLNGQGECVVHPDHEPILLSKTNEGIYEEVHASYLKFLCVKE